MSTIKKILLLVLLCSSLLAHPAFAEAGWTDVVAVAELVPTSRHYYEFRLAAKKNPSGCDNKIWFYQNYGSPGSDKMFNTLLEGLKSGIKIRAYVTGVCNINGYSEISSISIMP